MARQTGIRYAIPVFNEETVIPMLLPRLDAVAAPARVMRRVEGLRSAG